MIIKNDDAVIGLLQGMFDKNILTFNPDWYSKSENIDEFTGVREIQKVLKESGLQLKREADESTEGPEYITFVALDGILFSSTNIANTYL